MPWVRSRTGNRREARHVFGRRREREATRGFRQFVRERVIVHTIDRQSFRGFVARDGDDVIVLEHADRLTSVPGDVSLEARATPVGSVAILHRNVSVVQPLGALADEALDLALPVNVGGVADRVVPLVSEVAS